VPAPRRRPFTDEVARIGIADLRRSIGPSWRNMTSVALAIGGLVTEVELLDLPNATTFGGRKRWLRCTCGAAVMRLGHVDGVGFCCRGCARWKSRERG
jgi:hypothetical protein